MSTRRYHYRDVNLTKEAEVILNEIKQNLAMKYSNTEVVEVALIIMYKLIKKYKYRYLKDVLSHEV